MIVFDYIGKGLTYQKIVPGDTVTSIAASTYKYEERELAYTSGGVYVMAVGDMIVGATSSATAIITARTITSGTDAGGNAAGVLTIKCQVGTFQSENLNVEGNGNVATIAANSVAVQSPSPYQGQMAKSLLIVVESQTANIMFDGSLPSQSANQSVGIPLAATQSYVLRNIEDIKNLKVVDKTSGSASTVKLMGFF